MIFQQGTKWVCVSELVPLFGGFQGSQKGKPHFFEGSPKGKTHAHRAKGCSFSKGLRFIGQSPGKSLDRLKSWASQGLAEGLRVGAVGWGIPGRTVGWDTTKKMVFQHGKSYQWSFGALNGILIEHHI